MKYNIKIGNVYGELTVNSYSHTNANNKRYYNCVCSCGMNTVKTIYYILNSKNPSCGCKSNHSKPIDIIGNKIKISPNWILSN